MEVSRAVMLIFFAPLFLVIFAAITLDSGRPMFVRLLGIRPDGKPFLRLRFRTRHDASTKSNTIQSVRRIISLGSIRSPHRRINHALSHCMESRSARWTAWTRSRCCSSRKDGMNWGLPRSARETRADW